MSLRPWPRPARSTTARSTTATASGRSTATAATRLATAGLAALALLAAVTGCGGPASTGQARATQTAGVAAVTGAKVYTAAQLKDALLAKISGDRPAAAAEAGAYGKLPDVQTSKQSTKDVKVVPAKCADATVAGFNSVAFARAPAAVVTFRVGRDGVSEVLVSASSQLAKTALTDQLPAGCAYYKATIDGKTYSYAVRQSTVAGLADQARALNVKASGYAQVDVWSVVYRGPGFVGAVTMVGPTATLRGVKTLAGQAYSHAEQSLS
jgi:hypothetical protein